MDIKLIVDSLVKASRYVNELPFPNKLGLWLNAFKCFVLYGSTPTDWKFYEMYKYNHRENKEIITSKKSKKLDRLFNPREFARDFDDKEKYAAFVKRGWLFTKNSDRKEILDFVVRHQAVVVKPIGLSSGKGIYLYDNANKSRSDMEALLNEVDGKDFLLEERIELTPELKRLNPDSC